MEKNNANRDINNVKSDQYIFNISCKEGSQLMVNNRFGFGYEKLFPLRSSFPIKTKIFSGRVTEIQIIRANFNKNQLRNIQVISGIGGIGKSQIALEFIHRYESDYDIVYWLDCADKYNFISKYKNLAEVLEINITNKPFEIILNELNIKISKYKSLWIFDNVESSNDIINSLPNKGDIIITSRHKQWENFDNTITLNEFKPQDSLDFIAKTLIKNKYASRKKLKELGDELCHIPLALEQACAFINTTPYIDVDKYLKKFKEYQEKDLSLLLQYFMDDKDSIPLNYKYSLAKVWEITLKQIENENFNALIIMGIISLLANNKIHNSILFDNISILVKNFNCFEKERDLDFYLRIKCLKYLDNYCVLNVSDNYIQMHFLMKYVMQIYINNKKAIFEKTILDIVYTNFKVNEYSKKNALKIEPYLHQAREVLNKKYAIDNLDTASKLIQISNMTGKYFVKVGMYSDAIYDFQYALDIINNYPSGISELLELSILNNLGKAYLFINKPVEAKRLLESVLSRLLDDNLLTNEFQFLKSSILSNLGEIYSLENNFDQAIDIYNQSIHLDSLCIGYESVAVAHTYSKISQMYILKNEIEKAITHINKALEIEENFSNDSNNIGNYIRIKVQCLLAKEDYSKDAISLLKYVIELDKKICNSHESHLKLVEDLNLLSLLYYYNRDDLEAEKNVKKALQYIKEFNLENSNSAIGCKSNFGLLLLEKKEFQQALECFLQCESYCLDNFSSNHNLPAIMMNISKTYMNLKDYVNAKIYIQKAINKEYELYGDEYINSNKYIKRICYLKIIDAELSKNFSY